MTYPRLFGMGRLPVVAVAVVIGAAVAATPAWAQSATDIAPPDVAWAAPTAGRIAAEANLTTALGLPECTDGSVLSFDRVRFGGRGWGCVDRVTNATTATVADALDPSRLPTCGTGEVLKASAQGFFCVDAATATAEGINCPDGKVLTSNGRHMSCVDSGPTAPTLDIYAWESNLGGAYSCGWGYFHYGCSVGNPNDGRSCFQSVSYIGTCQLGVNCPSWVRSDGSGSAYSGSYGACGVGGLTYIPGN